jgi:hypothetical protein
MNQYNPLILYFELYSTASARGNVNKEGAYLKGWKQIVKAPENRPNWMQEKIIKPLSRKRK